MKFVIQWQVHLSIPILYLETQHILWPSTSKLRPGFYLKSVADLVQKSLGDICSSPCYTVGHRRSTPPDPAARVCENLRGVFSDCHVGNSLSMRLLLLPVLRRENCPWSHLYPSGRHLKPHVQCPSAWQALEVPGGCAHIPAACPHGIGLGWSSNVGKNTAPNLQGAVV